MSISILFLVQAQTFEKTLLKYRRRITDDMKAAAVLILEGSTRKLNPSWAFLLTLCISKPFAFQTPDFHKKLLNQRRIITNDLEAVAVVVSEISTAKLKSNLVSFLTFSISKAFEVQKPYFEKILVN